MCKCQFSRFDVYYWTKNVELIRIMETLIRNMETLIRNMETLIRNMEPLIRNMETLILRITRKYESLL